MQSDVLLWLSSKFFKDFLFHLFMLFDPFEVWVWKETLFLKLNKPLFCFFFFKLATYSFHSQFYKVLIINRIKGGRCDVIYRFMKSGYQSDELMIYDDDDGWLWLKRHTPWLTTCHSYPLTSEHVWNIGWPEFPNHTNSFLQSLQNYKDGFYWYSD